MTLLYSLEHDGGESMNENQAIAMWKLGFGNMNDVLFGIDKPEQEKRRAIKSDWETHRMPRTRSHFDLDIELSNDDFETLAWGHIPEEMKDHWFMYFDGEAFCFYRSWTGFCIYRAYVKRSENPENREGYAIYRATVNRSKKQYGEENDKRDAVSIAILIGQALGGDVDKLWERYFELGE